MKKSRSQSPRSAAFTLLEVLVSSAVLAIVLAIMFSALSTSMSLWRNTDNKIVADREGRAVGMMLSRDLANIVVPADTNLRPRVTNVVTRGAGRVNVTNSFLKFLATVPSEGQSPTGAEPGDVCYVEYAILSLPSGGREVRRLLRSSTNTFSTVIQAGAFPSSPTTPDLSEYQSLGLYLLPTNSMAARGLGTLGTDPQEMAYNTNRLVVLGTDMLPYVERPGNYPAAIEVNFAVADPDSLANTNVIANPNYVLRNAGLYSFRIPLRKPPNAP